MGLHHNAFYTSTSIGNTCFQKWQLIPWHSGAADLECKINDTSTELWSHAKEQNGCMWNQERHGLPVLTMPATANSNS
jgi:hypothetical protein